MHINSCRDAFARNAAVPCNLRRSSAKMRYAFTTTVKDGKMEEYLHYHDHIWPEVCRGLRAAGVTSGNRKFAPWYKTIRSGEDVT